MSTKEEREDLRLWIETHCTPDVLRAFLTGYEVQLSVANQIFAMLEETSKIPCLRSWDDIEERRSPNERSFASYDSVDRARRRITLPTVATVLLGRISRISIDSELTTGLPVHVVVQGKEYTRCFDFESDLAP